MEQWNIPVGYREVLEDYAKKNSVSKETAFSNLMDFIQLKDQYFSEILVYIENAEDYLEGGEEIPEEELQLAYMESFGENTVGAMVKSYFHRAKSKDLLLTARYDSELSCWEILSLFQRKIPSMDLQGESLCLYYVEDMKSLPEAKKSFSLLENEEGEDYCKAGYFPSIYVEEDEEEWEEE